MISAGILYNEKFPPSSRVIILNFTKRKISMVKSIISRGKLKQIVKPILVRLRLRNTLTYRTILLVDLFNVLKLYPKLMHIGWCR